MQIAMEVQMQIAMSLMICKCIHVVDVFMTLHVMSLRFF